MRKKVLLAEASVATRNVAETVLRQNGFDVTAVADGSSAVKIIENSRPDLILVGVDMVLDGVPVYRLALDSPQAAGKPILVFANAGISVDRIPPERTIPRPFNPRDFLDKVMAAVTQPAPLTAHSVDSEASLSIDDDLLDNALGLQGTGALHITESEVLNKTRPVRAASQPESTPDELDQSGCIESIIISEEQTDIKRPETKKTRKPSPEPSGTGALDILSDQYGLTSLNADDLDSGNDHAAHDYNWFVSEMAREANAPPSHHSPEQTSSGSPSDHKASTDNELTFESLTPVEKPSRTRSTDSKGVERFIDEFKREIEKLHTDEPDSLTLRDEPKPKTSGADWEEVVESITPDQVALFTRQLSADIAERIAAKIVQKIDTDKLTNLIKAEIMAHIKEPKDR